MRTETATILHCQHRVHGACDNKACQRQVEASFDTSGSGRILWEREAAWGFPNAQALARFTRERYATQGRSTRDELLRSLAR